MIKLNFKKLVTSIMIMAVFSHCQRTPKVIYILSETDRNIMPVKVSISSLAENYKEYHGQYIETVGRFYAAFEEFAIYTKPTFFTGEQHGFWLDLDDRLNIDEESLIRMAGHQVHLKGILDTTDQGHLGVYLGTIKKIYFWEEK